MIGACRPRRSKFASHVIVTLTVELCWTTNDEGCLSVAGSTMITVRIVAQYNNQARAL